MFVADAAATVKKAFERYTDNMTYVSLETVLADLNHLRYTSATTMTQTQLSGHARKAVDKISSEKDVSRLSSNITRALASAIPKPTLYYNYSLGECADLIFGTSLVDYATARGLADGDAPKIVRICIHEVDTRGLDCEGIYRVSLVSNTCPLVLRSNFDSSQVSGRHAVVQTVRVLL
jgi:hypothetical protein